MSNQRLPVGREKEFDGALAPLDNVTDCTASAKQLKLARMGHPNQWAQTWGNVERLLTRLIVDRCIPLSDIEVQVGVMTTHGSPQVTAQVRYRANPQHPHEQPGALQDPGWMLN